MAELDRATTQGLWLRVEGTSARSLPRTQVAAIVLAAVEQIPPPETSEWLAAPAAAAGPLDTVDTRRVTALLVYCYSHGVLSSRAIEAASTTDPVVALLAARPRDPGELRAFRRAHHAALGAVFVEVYRRCAAMGLAKLGQVMLIERDSPLRATGTRGIGGEPRELRALSLGVADTERLLAEAEQEDRDDDVLLGASQREPSLAGALAGQASGAARLHAMLAQLDSRAHAR